MIPLDGEQVWLVDWEASFLNDRYADLAVVANQLVTNDTEEKFYLERYFGQPADEHQLARFYLMQQNRLLDKLTLGPFGACTPKNRMH